MNSKTIFSFFLLSFIICISFDNAKSASRFNENDDPNQYVTIGHFVVRQVKADRSMRSNSFDPEKEDHWKIWMHFTVVVTDFTLRWKALDGTNDQDTRTYTDHWDTVDPGWFSKSHDNFPTYVDNMEIRITYTYGGTNYDYTFYIYTVGGVKSKDEGSAPLAIDYSIPEDETDTDGDGAYSGDSVGSIADPVGEAVDAIYDKLASIVKPIKDVVDSIQTLVRAPYDFLMWITNENTWISLFIGFVIIFLSFWAMMRVPLAYAALLLIPFFIGISMIVATALEGIGVWNP